MSFYLPTISVEQITNLYLFGQPTKPTDLTNVSLIRPTLPPDVAAQTVETDAISYMQTGGGRFATGAARVGRTRLRYAACNNLS